MKETFDELYTRLYNENFEELEEKRKKEFNPIILIGAIIVIIAVIRNYNSFD